MHWKNAGIVLVVCGMIGVGLGFSASSIADSIPGVQQQGAWARGCFTSGTVSSPDCRAQFAQEDNVKRWADRGWTIVGVSVVLVIFGSALLAAAREPVPPAGDQL